MAMYKHLNTGAVAELIEKKENTVKMKVVETNEVKEIGSATFKRWWKIVPKEKAETAAVAEAPEAVESQNAPAEAQVAQNEPESVEAGEDTAKKTDATTETQEPQNESLAEKPEENKNESAPLALSDVVKKLEGLFDMLNDIYFEGKLPRPVITVQSTPKAYGHCTSKKIWKSGVEGEGDAYYEINIGAEYLNRPSENTAATMCHEMVHLFCRENELDETCQKGRYHNKLFKQEAEKRDLKIDYDRTIGYSITAPTDVFTEKLRAAGYALEVPFARHTIEKAAKKSDREKAHKYYCAVCGQEVRTTSELSLICGICEIPMERAD